MEDERAVGPLLAWRLWVYYREFGGERPCCLLRSLGGYFYWPQREPMRAVCALRYARHRADDVPNLSCRCGLYGYKLAPSVAEQRRAIERALCGLPDFLVLIVGTVALWGRVVEYDEGYRAELAYPVSLCVLHLLDRTFPAARAAEIADGLADGYGVPVKTCKIFPLADGWRFSAGLEWEFDDVLTA